MAASGDSKFLGVFSWGGSRDASPGSADDTSRGDDTRLPATGMPDHKVSQRHRLSLAKQPRDLPRLDIRWFHAVDVAKTKPSFIQRKDEKPVKPKKWNAFSIKDSRAIEQKFVQLSEEEERQERLNESTGTSKIAPISEKVPCSEDFLFEVDVINRELSPVYWDGSIFEVRRGTWFDGATGAPTEENLAKQLEDGYVKNAPWRAAPEDNTAPVSLKNHRLFGSYMNQTATYAQGTSTAFVLSDDFLSKVSAPMLQRLTGSAGTKYVRGYSEVIKKKGEPKKTDSSAKDGVLADSAQSTAEQRDTVAQPLEEPQSPTLRSLERQVSNLTGRASQEAEAKAAEEERLRQEAEMLQDYRDEPGEQQDREVDHLLLVTHGIGQRLGARFETFDFVHDVNQFRKTLKSTYKSFPDLQALNGETGDGNNCRLQVLPISWRHKLTFPLETASNNKQTHDITDLQDTDDSRFPGLNDITLEGVPALRNLIGDLALDVLLYSTRPYKERISKIVVEECNRVVKLYKKRNPTFSGRVSFVGHSLGSVIMLDILSEQQNSPASYAFERHSRPSGGRYHLHFPVHHFYALGSPMGLFSLLESKKIAGRKNPNKVTLDGSSDDLEEHLSLPADTEAASSVSSPQCSQLYNLFFPSDPVAYRVEPLISTSMSEMQPQALPFVKKNFFSQPMGQYSARMGQFFSWSNLSSGLTNSFITRSLGLSPEDAARLGAQQARSTQQLAVNEVNPSSGAGTGIAGGVVGAEASSAATATAREVEKSMSNDQKPPTLIDDDLETLYSGFLKRKLIASRDLGDGPQWVEAEERGRRLRREEAKVRSLNRNGRVDYAIQESAFEISFLSAVASHLAYWTNTDVCHFLTGQMLSQSRKARSASARP